MDTVEAPPRKSYLDVIKTKLPADKNFSPQYLVVIVGTYPRETDRQEVSTNYQKLFKSLQTETDKITGMLLLFKTCFVHVLQVQTTNKSSRSQLYQFLDDCRANIKAKRFIQARLLVLIDDIKEKYFPFWASRVVDGQDDPSHVDFAMLDAKAIDDLVSNTCVQVLKVGTALGQMNKNDMKQAFEDIQEYFRGMVPTMALTEDLAGCNDILSVEAWMNEFAGHMDVVLESELIWPAPRPLLI